MKIILRDVISEIEEAQKRAVLLGRSVETVLLSTEEGLEFKREYKKRFPDDTDEMFKGDTFWKGTEVKVRSNQ